MRRHGAHHVAQKSTRTTPFFTSSPKFASVNVFTFSDAIEPRCAPFPWKRLLKDLQSCLSLRCRRAGEVPPLQLPVHFDILGSGAAPREVRLHPVLLQPGPDF